MKTLTKRLFMAFTIIFALGSTVLAAESASYQIREEGLASWYGVEFKGRKTSNGEVFDPELYTAAHRLLPFGSVVTVTNLQNNKSVQVRVNDRGPFVEGRSIDLSKAAAEAIGMIGGGVARVRLETTLQSLPAGMVVETGVIKMQDSPRVQTVAAITPEDPLRTVQVASYANRDSALNLIKYLHDNGIEATEEIPGSAVYRVVIAGIPLSRVASLQSSLAQLGFPQVLVRQK